MCKFFGNYFSKKVLFFLSFLIFSLLFIFAIMITDQYIRDEFVSEVLRRDINIIYNTQQEVVDRYLKVRTGTLRTKISRHEFDLKTSPGRAAVFIRVLPYMRFLDMQYRGLYSGSNKLAKKKRANIAIYNRIVWGVLYHETFPDIKAGFTDEVRNAWRRQMEDALNNRILPNEIKS